MEIGWSVVFKIQDTIDSLSTRDFPISNVELLLSLRRLLRTACFDFTMKFLVYTEGGILLLAFLLVLLEIRRVKCFVYAEGDILLLAFLLLLLEIRLEFPNQLLLSLGFIRCGSRLHRLTAGDRIQLISVRMIFAKRLQGFSECLEVLSEAAHLVIGRIAIDAT
jgi:hypothetical protein